MVVVVKYVFIFIWKFARQNASWDGQVTNRKGILLVVVVVYCNTCTSYFVFIRFVLLLGNQSKETYGR